MWDKLLSFIAPYQCVVCGTEGAALCAWCLPDALPALPSRCYRCGKLTRDYATCSPCKRSTNLSHVWPVTTYMGTAVQLLELFKFDRARQAHLLIAEQMAEVLPIIAADTLVVFVPTATTRVRRRGYDHAYLLARQIAKKRGLSLVKALSRQGYARQVGATRSARFAQAARNYSVIDPAQIRGKKLLLVDDIITTGATLEATARLLKKAGAKQVDALVFAHRAK